MQTRKPHNTLTIETAYKLYDKISKACHGAEGNALMLALTMLLMDVERSAYTNKHARSYEETLDTLIPYLTKVAKYRQQQHHEHMAKQWESVASQLKR
jgi:hypothetical protein